MGINSSSNLVIANESTVGRLFLNTAGNVGVGVTPLLWGITSRALTLQSPGSGIQGALANSGVSDATSIVNNAYYSSGWKYGYTPSSVAASRYDVSPGQHDWYVAAAGAGGNAITFTQAMTLASTGFLTVTGGATIQGLTVGLGAGAVSTNTAVGVSALSGGSLSGARNIGIGINAGNTISTGAQNTFVGSYCGTGITTGTQNIGIGDGAMTGNSSNATGSYNVGVGALTALTSGSNNVGVGYQALNANNSASSSTAVGYQAGYNNTIAGSGVYIGAGAGYTNAGGGGNTFVGANAGNLFTAASGATYNAFFGAGSGSAVTSGQKNTIIGGYSGNQNGLNISAASNYIVLSDGDGNPRMYNTGSYFWALSGTSASTCGAFLFRNSSQTQYWNMEASDTNWYLFSNSTYVYFAQGASAWVFASDRRIKTDIVDIDYGLDTVMAMKPRKYKMIESGKTNIGFVAQELKDIVPEAVTGEEIQYQDTDTQKEKAEKTMGVSKDTLIPVLVKAIQELKAEVDSLKAQINGA
jgi:hypothetical protein